MKSKKTTMKISLLIVFVLLMTSAFLIACVKTASQPEAKAPVVKTKSTKSKTVATRQMEVTECFGSVQLVREESKMPVSIGMRLEDGDTLHVAANGEASLRMDDDKFITLAPDTSIDIIASGTKSKGKLQINLTKGTILSHLAESLDTDSTYEVHTPTASLAVRGTTFAASYAEESQVFQTHVFEGTVQTQIIANSTSHLLSANSYLQWGEADSSLQTGVLASNMGSLPSNIIKILFQLQNQKPELFEASVSDIVRISYEGAFPPTVNNSVPSYVASVVPSDSSSIIATTPDKVTPTAPPNEFPSMLKEKKIAVTINKDSGPIQVPLIWDDTVKPLITEGFHVKSTTWKCYTTPSDKDFVSPFSPDIPLLVPVSMGSIKHDKSTNSCMISGLESDANLYVLCTVELSHVNDVNKMHTVSETVAHVTVKYTKPTPR